LKRKSRLLWIGIAIFLLTLSPILPIFHNVHAEGAGLVNGTYEGVDYRYLKDGTAETSAAHGYLYVANSGRLIIEDDTIIFEHEITAVNKDYLPYIGYRLPGKPKAVISGDNISGMDGYQQVQPERKDNGNYVIRYKMEDVTKALDILMHVHMENVPGMPGGIYDNWYNVQLQLDTSTLPIDVETDKSELEKVLEEARHLFNTVHPRGTLIPYVYSEGEHGYAVPEIQRRLANAENVYNNPNATQTEVDAAIESLKFAMDSVKRDQFFKIEPLRFRVLNSIGDDAELSEHAGDFGEETTAVLKQFGTYQTVANIPVHLPKETLQIYKAADTANGGFSSAMSKVYFVEAKNDTNIYQINIRHKDAGDDVWKGISYVKYNTDGVEKEVYLNFNVNIQEDLKDFVELAKKIDPSKLEADGEHVNTFQTSLNEAEKVSNKLAATRVEILSATQALKEAVTNILKTKHYDAGTYVLSLADFGADFANFVEKSHLIVDENGQLSLQIIPKANVEVSLQNQETGEEIAADSSHIFKDIDPSIPYTIEISNNGETAAYSVYFALITAELLAEPEQPGGNPEQPAEPEQPGEDPEQPAEPEQPGENPEQPAEPEQPGENPEQPAEPEQPGEDPEQPAEPEQPGENPEQPAEPEQPGEDPEQPAEPEQPEEKIGQPTKSEQLAEEKKELEGKKLPNTATNQFNFLLIGIILLGMGSICFAVVRKKYN